MDLYKYKIKKVRYVPKCTIYMHIIVSHRYIKRVYRLHNLNHNLGVKNHVYVSKKEFVCISSHRRMCINSIICIIVITDHLGSICTGRGRSELLNLCLIPIVMSIIKMCSIQFLKIVKNN